MKLKVVEILGIPFAWLLAVVGIIVAGFVMLFSVADVRRYLKIRKM